jgi:type I restriction enzyme M protein
LSVGGTPSAIALHCPFLVTHFEQSPRAASPLDTLTTVITGELRSKVDKVWDAFWSGGVSNPLQVVEQFTYLLFLRRLDELQTLAENKATRTGQPVERAIFPGGPSDPRRWKNFANLDPAAMFDVVAQKVFPFLRELGGEGSNYATHMKDATFVIPTPALLDRVVDLVGDIPMTDRDTNGDLYEYMLSKIASAGTNGQFRTPRHIIQLMVDMMAPTPKDEIIDPACGTAGFLVAAAEYLRREYPNLLLDEVSREHFTTRCSTATTSTPRCCASAA